MLPEQIIRLREELGCNPSELAKALGVPAADVVAWESGERFPTKRSVDRMNKLRERHQAAAREPQAAPQPRTTAPATAPPLDWQALATPKIWALLRKLLAHPELRAQVEPLAAQFDDPAESPPLGD